MECLALKQPSTVGSLPRGLDRLGEGGGGGGFGLGGCIPSTVPVANYFSSVRQGLNKMWKILGQMSSYLCSSYCKCLGSKNHFCPFRPSEKTIINIKLAL